MKADIKKFLISGFTAVAFFILITILSFKDLSNLFSGQVNVANADTATGTSDPPTADSGCSEGSCGSGGCW